MLRSYSLDFGGSWEVHWPLAEFAYKNSYQANISITPCKALYGRSCRLLLYWADGEECVILRAKIIHETIEKVRMIKERIKAVQSCQKNYADLKRCKIEFEVGDYVSEGSSKVRCYEIQS